MIPLPFLPGDARRDINPGSWLVQLSDRHDCRLKLEPGIEVDWLSMTAKWPDSRGNITAMWAAQEERRGIKVVPNQIDAHPEVLGELPVARGKWSARTLQWAEAVFQQIIACLALGKVDEADSRPQEDSLPKLLADLHYPTETREDGAILQQVSSARGTRSVSWQAQDNWLRGESAVAMGVPLPCKDPMDIALSYHLLKLSACMRMARASYHAHGDGTTTLSFVVDLPCPVDSVRLRHGTLALVTGIDRFEQEIEHLATEADLARAYLSLHRNAFRR